MLYRYNAFQFPVALVLDTLNVPHTPLSGQHLFQTQVGKDMYAYLQVILFPTEAVPADFERVLKRPNKYFTNRLIAAARNWNSFLHLSQNPNLRGWEREKLIDLTVRIENFSKLAGTPGTLPVDFMGALKTDFGLSDFYRDQSRLSDDLDQANEEDLLEVIIALSENFQTIPDFYQFVCKSIDNEECRTTGQSRRRSQRKDEVYLGTIHRAKGKEFQNVVYFNLSKTGAVSEKLREEERRVAYVGATRPKDSLLITFSSAKPSKFLAEISLNPKFEGFEAEELERKSDAVKLRLKKEAAKLRQIELQKGKLVIQFEHLTEDTSAEKSALLLRFTWMIANWRIIKTQKKIDVLNRRIRKQTETVIDPLLMELNDLEEETHLRNALKAA